MEDLAREILRGCSPAPLLLVSLVQEDLAPGSHDCGAMCPVAGIH